MAKKFQDKLVQLREGKQLSQRDLAQLASLSPDAVSRLERGLADPKPPQIVALALALGVSTDVLLGLDGDLKRAEDDELADVRRLLKVSRRLGARELNLVAQIAEALAVSGNGGGA